MEISDLVQRFSDTPQHQRKAIFSQLMIAATRLQTVFDQEIPQITLKQFMLLTIVRQSDSELTLTEAGKLLGCSRQNVKKLAEALVDGRSLRIEGGNYQLCDGSEVYCGCGGCRRHRLACMGRTEQGGCDHKNCGSIG